MHKQRKVQEMYENKHLSLQMDFATLFTVRLI